MLDLSTIKVVAERVRHRWFPERQLYFRANGVVRFVSFSPRIQMVAAAAVLCFVGWVVLTSVNFLSRDAVIAAKEQRIDELARSYDALDAEMRRLQFDVLATTKRLKERQNYLRELIDETAADAPANVSKSKADPSPGPEVEARPARGGLVARILKAEGEAGDGFSLESLQRELLALDNRQQTIARELAVALSAEIDSVVTVLQRTGLSKEGVMRVALGPDFPDGQGGPFVAEAEQTRVRLVAQSASPDSFDLLLKRQSELRALQAVLKNAPFAKPLSKYYVSSSFGPRRDPFHGRRAVHGGVDMASYSGAPVKSAAGGSVKVAGRKGAYGNLIEIDHGNGFVTRYGHLRTIKVKVGQIVSAGDVIGLVGSTGRSSGPHLHYEIWFDGKTLNPVNFFRAAEDVFTLSRSSDRVS